MSRKAAPTEVARFLDAWFAVRQYIQATNFNRFQAAGLSATQFMTLNLLPAPGDGIAIGELARRMSLKPATIAKTVDSLESRDLVRRVRSETDRRSVHVAITVTGAELQNAATGQFRAQMKAVFGTMTLAERHGLVTGLESLARATLPATRASHSTNAVRDDAAAPTHSSRRSRLR